MSDVNSTLQERGKRYGEFEHQAWYAQGIKAIMQSSPNWVEMEDDQREALDLIANKIGRILNGDPNYDDSWLDIGGYAQLIVNRLRKEQSAKEVEDYNKRVALYLDDLIRDEGTVVENGDYDPIHNGPVSIYAGEGWEALHPLWGADGLDPKVTEALDQTFNG